MKNAIQIRIAKFGAATLLGCALLVWIPNTNAEEGPSSQSESGAVASCDQQWHIMATANAATQANDYNSLDAVAALSPTDVWAVGDFNRFTQSGQQTLIEHWDGKKWKLVNSPNSSQLVNILAGVSATSTNNAWAVGYQSPASGPYSTLIEHWDGKTWKIVRSGTVTGLLTSVAAVAPDDAWAVGSTDYVGNGLILHWNGKSWTQTIVNQQVYFRAVAAVNKNDIWAVGQLTNSTGVGDLTYAVHFDGKRWTHVPTPSPFRKHNLDQDWLTSLTVVSSNDVWASAVWRDGDFGILDHTFAEHWDGNQWQIVQTLNPGGNSQYHDFWGIAALTPENIWAVGSAGLNTLHPFAEHWDGKAWNLARTVPIADGSLHAITGVTSSSWLLTTGNHFKNGFTQALAEYACGVQKSF
jgi:hypothetical protein